MTAITIATATGTLARKLSMKSAERAASPVTPTVDPVGSGTSRTSATSSRPASVSGRRVEKTVTLDVSPATVWATQSARPGGHEACGADRMARYWSVGMPGGGMSTDSTSAMSCSALTSST